MSAEQDGEPALSQASVTAGAVFLSYASEDAAAAERIATALHNAGIEVWFDKSELRGGDAWDRHIREQIHNCRLFIAVVSSHTEARDEGYFRREWRLAVERAGDMAEDKTFVVPVAIDGTSERSARVPDPFKHVQWTRLPGGETTPAFVERVQRLLSPDSSPARRATLSGSTSVPISPTSVRQPRRSKAGLWVTGAVIAVALAAIAVGRFLLSRHSPPPTPPAAPATQPAAPALATAATFNPPPHSVAVLPFVNMSGDKDQEYFSDGLTEEILNSLARINELQVTARTSSFSFKGKDTDVGTIAHKLNVGAILEGSVRRSGHTVRITTQLVNAATGFHLWSETYDRDLRDVLKLQTEIATAVARALKVTLLGDVAMKSELGGTSNPAALDAYLRGRNAHNNLQSSEAYLRAAAAYTEAIRLDPGYAFAFAGRSLVLNDYAANWATGTAVQDGFTKAGDDARRAVALAPDLADAHLALAYFFTQTLALRRADEEYARASALAPGNVAVLEFSGLFTTQMGRIETGLAVVRQVVQLDPLTAGTQGTYGYALYLARRYEAALTAYGHAISAAPDDPTTRSLRGLVYYALGNLESARSSCQDDSESVDTFVCLSITSEKLGQRADAQATLARFVKLRGEADAYAYAEIYAQWGDTARALEWLEKSLRLRDSGLILLKTDPLMDPLRREPRFQAIERELKFPD